MSTMQRITLIGMYNYDTDLFTNLSLPEGYDTQTFIDSLLLEHGEKCVMYTDVDFMKYSIGAVSRKWQLELGRIYDALTAEYDPISNYDRHEIISDSRGRKFNDKTSADYTDARTDNLQSKRTANLQDKRTADLQNQRTAGLTYTDSQTVAGTTEREVSAFDSSSYSPSEKNTYNNGTSTKTEAGLDTVKTTGTDTMDKTGTDTMNNTGTQNTRHAGTLSDRTGGETENSSHTAHMYGNIGVTTNVQMWSAEVQERFKNNLYGIAADIFARELTLGVY